MTTTAVQAAEYFVDAGSGKDSNTGLSATQPWQSVRRVNQAPLQPGDTVRFKAGGEADRNCYIDRVEIMSPAN